MAEKQNIFNSHEALHIIRKCFRNFDSEESKEMLWQWFTLTITGNFAEQEKHTIENLISFYTHLEIVLEATAVLAEEEKN